MSWCGGLVPARRAGSRGVVDLCSVHSVLMTQLESGLRLPLELGGGDRVLVPLCVNPSGCERVAKLLGLFTHDYFGLSRSALSCLRCSWVWTAASCSSMLWALMSARFTWIAWFIWFSCHSKTRTVTTNPE